jgi:hypothetical protein
VAWVDQHTFTDGELVNVEWLKSMWTNMRNAHDPNELFQRQNADNDYGLTTSSTFVAVSPTWMRGTIRLTATRNIMIVSNVVSFASAGDTQGELDLTIDGVSIGTNDGIAVIDWKSQPTATPIVWYANNLAAGAHGLVLQHRRVVGTGNIQTAIFYRHWFRAVEL